MIPYRAKVEPAAKFPVVEKENVIELNQCSDDEMIDIVQTSKASLFPSFDEGWGLGITESLALGTSVICSDIPVCRETSQGNAIYLDPIDGLGWFKKIKEFSYSDLYNNISSFKVISWYDSVEKMKYILLAGGLKDLMQRDR